MTDRLKSDHQILVTKASGEQEAFSINKLKGSLRNAGAAEPVINQIVDAVLNWLTPGVSTKKIYRKAFSLLRYESDSSGLRYRLKQAILELGPTGYPFETLIGQLFAKQGYDVEVGIVVDGTCVTHEMDVIATGATVQHLVECKYSKHQGKQVSVQVPLYVRSRVDDIIKTRSSMPENAHLKFEGWVVTNTRFSDDSLQYGRCSGLNLLGWDYPGEKSLKYLIEYYKIYPITILTGLTISQKQQLMDKGIVCCNQLLENMDVLKQFNFSARRISKVKSELEHIS